MNNDDNIICIACSVFRKEIEILRQTHKLGLPVAYLDSMLHIYPEKLRHLMDKAVERELKKGKKIILIYGECHAYMPECVAHPDVERVKGVNCIEIILGSEKYRKIRKDRIFCFLPEWTKRWEEIFRDHLGLNRDNARSFMRDMHSKLVYLDTGVTPVPTHLIQAITDYTGLDMDILPVSADALLSSISEVRARFAI